MRIYPLEDMGSTLCINTRRSQESHRSYTSVVNTVIGTLRGGVGCSIPRKFDRMFRLVDSMILRAQIQKEHYGFGTLTATRIAEIQTKMGKN